MSRHAIGFAKLLVATEMLTVPVRKRDAWLSVYSMKAYVTGAASRIYAVRLVVTKQNTTVPCSIRSKFNVVYAHKY